MTFPKRGQTAGYFSKNEYVPDIFQENNGYRHVQPIDARKRGFGSSDAHKRDEFTLEIRAAQYRELLKSELTMAKKVIQSESKETAHLPSSLSSLVSTSSSEPTADQFQTHVPKHLYDLRFDDTVSTPPCQKCSRDVFYCKHRAQLQSPESLRRTGSVRTSNMDFGSTSSTQVPTKPQFGIRSSVKSFFDHGHLRPSHF